MTDAGEGGAPRPAPRARAIEPFRVMDILARARALERAGRDIVHFEIGEPDFPTPPAIVEAAVAALRAGDTRYTPALGLSALREALADFYRDRFGLDVAPARIALTPGASGALQLALGALLEPGHEVLMADPGYPCNRHIVNLLGGRAVPVRVDASTNWQPTAKDVVAHWGPRTAGVLLASPANPTGTLIDPAELARIRECVRARGGFLIVDEIYQSLVYEDAPRSALALGDDVVVVNSFSKYFDMTGWRLGWLVAPESLIPAIDRLAQNLFLAAPTPAQHGALAAFTPETLALLEERRREFAARRDLLCDALVGLGFGIPRRPAGAFYLYADCTRFTDDSDAFCTALLEEDGVAVTPGGDFGAHGARGYVRFAYTTSRERLALGLERLARRLGSRGQ